MNVPAHLVTAVEHALRAPSVHNTQPWRWRITQDAVQLHADWNRHLVATDPDRRDLVLSCGAALHHLLVALAANGMPAQVERLPDVDNSGHLATVTVGSGTAHAADPSLFPAITRRRTDRRRMSHRPVPAEHLQELIEAARRAGALVLPVSGEAMRERLPPPSPRARSGSSTRPATSPSSSSGPGATSRPATACPGRASRPRLLARPVPPRCASSRVGSSANLACSPARDPPMTPPRCS